jgi:hypothetical protein
LFTLIGLVAVLHAIAITAYYTLHIGGATPRRQTTFAGVWTVLTLAIVLVGLARIRAARLRARLQRR